MLAAAFAAVIWYVYDAPRSGTTTASSLPRLDEAFDLLGLLHSSPSPLLS